MNGYTGKALIVDLADRNAIEQALAESLLRDYLGGAGLAVRLLYDHLTPGVDALDPDNVIVFSCGLFAGTIVSASAKHAVATKSPLTGMIGDAMAGSFFSHTLKRAGYDAVVIKGKAEVPTYLFIDDSDVFFRNAEAIWGQGCFDTEEFIREELGDEAIRVSSIGPAGENLVRYACISNDRGRQAGRTGPGAVMGSKNLKAIAVRGSGVVSVDNSTAVYQVTRELNTLAQGPATGKYRHPGTNGNVLVLNRLGVFPTRNFQRTEFAKADHISGENIYRHYHDKTVACAACPIACEQIMRVAGAEPHEGARVSLDYETLFALGPCCDIDDIPAIIRAAELCDEFGLDTISTGVTIAWAMEAFEKRLLSAQDGFELRFGDAEAMVAVIPMIAQREGLGALLAEGSRRAAETLGKDSDYFAMHGKGLEFAGYDPRGMKTYALGLAVGTRGACHNRSLAYEPDLQGQVDRHLAEKGRGALAMKQEDIAVTLDSVGVCKFLRGCFSDMYEELAQLYTNVTGWDMNSAELRQAGERISNLKKLFNIREGWTRDLDRLPPRIHEESVPDGPGKNIPFPREELEIMVADYYEARGWTGDGRVAQPTLDRLGLADVPS